MNELSANKIRTRTAWDTTGALIVLAIALTISVLMAQPASTTTTTTAKRDWNSMSIQDKIDVFNAVLTKSSADAAFRTRLKESTEEAKKAVAEQGNMTIPDDVFIMFYEPSAGRSMKTATKFSGEINDKYHVFALPPVGDGKQHFYKDHLMCCYPPWRPPTPAPRAETH